MSVSKTTKALTTLVFAAGLGLTVIHTGKPLAAGSANGDDHKISNPKLSLESSADYGPGDKPELGEAGGVRGVNPADNLTKFELLPKFSMIDGDNDVTLSTLTLKYDRAIKGKYGINLELPISYFDSRFGDDFGVSDLNVRGRVQFRGGRWIYITGLETVFPIATADTLGSGKYQLNPTVVAVHAFSAQTFAAGIAKHLFSVAGDKDRDEIVQGQYRLLAAHTFTSGWWCLVDPQLWVDYHNDGRVQFSCDGEIGKMVGKTTGVWIHGGSRIAGDWHKEDWSISAGIRFVFF
ncbi:MAG TPA: hypothetical protein PKM43_13080 [Verrucomicrobiota bacterium]|nr:hypothetical protein [Verrucomicrobiota bacterium]HRZ36231.1 hypothetical protein [Candidatus Paceibacterota bacterium]HRZ56091.1 hypothetical protein [Candidatus Paceibacterota bacterium]